MAAHANLFAVSYPAFQATGSVRLPRESFLLAVVGNLIMHFRAGKRTGFSSGADRYCFHGRDRHNGLGQTTVQLQVPGGVRPESRGYVARRYFEDSTQRVAFRLSLVDQLDHLLLRGRVGAAERRIIWYGSNLIEGQLERTVRNASQLDHVTTNLDVELGQQLSRDRPASYAGGGFAGRGALQNIAQVARVVLEAAGQIRMTGTRAFHPTRFLWRNFAYLGGHHFVPVGPVFVLDGDRHRRSECQTMADAAEDFDAVLLDLHAGAAAIPLLTPPQFVIDLIDIDGQTGGQTFNNRDQCATVRFAGGSETEHGQ